MLRVRLLEEMGAEPQFLNRDPFECVLCGGRMVYRRAVAGLNVSGLKKNARDISLLRYILG